MIKLTIDTNVLLSGLDGTEERRAVFERLMQLRELAVVDIGLSTRFEKDKQLDADIERVKRDYAIARWFPVVPGPFRLDVSRLGQDLLADGEVMDKLQRLFGIDNPANANSRTLWDVDHLYGHFAAGRDYFLTWEERILKKSRHLAELGIRVLRPDAFLADRESML